MLFDVYKVCETKRFIPYKRRMNYSIACIFTRFSFGWLDEFLHSCDRLYQYYGLFDEE